MNSDPKVVRVDAAEKGSSLATEPADETSSLGNLEAHCQDSASKMMVKYAHPLAVTGDCG